MDDLKISINRLQRDRVFIHPDCVDDLESLIRINKRAEFYAAYEDRLDYLTDHFGSEINHRKWFEVLKNADGMRSMRFVTIDNLRILYVIDRCKALLLHAFEERSGKKRTDYSSHIKVAQARLNET